MSDHSTLPPRPSLGQLRKQAKDLLHACQAGNADARERVRAVSPHLVADSAQEVRLERLGLTLHFPAGEDIWTESSYKFTRAGVEAMLDQTGLRLAQWHVDPANYFALALAEPSR